MLSVDLGVTWNMGRRLLHGSVSFCPAGQSQTDRWGLLETSKADVRVGILFSLMSGILLLDTEALLFAATSPAAPKAVKSALQVPDHSSHSPLDKGGFVVQLGLGGGVKLGRAGPTAQSVVVVFFPFLLEKFSKLRSC